jgi:protein phosphatase 1 regulatory subunit 7
MDFPELDMLELGANKIEVIENLEKLPKLRQLYMGKNKVSKIENLDCLSPTLETLVLTVRQKYIYQN